ncbi:ATP-binding cassette domain-containing protein [bacterium]|nr:ATP-binding cassette domain-containing protein [bacterium]
MKNNLIYLENVNVNYGEFNALKNINLEINEGEAWAIMGANGSGKSTLVKLFTNDLYPFANEDYKKIFFGRERWDIFELKKNFGIVTDTIQNDFLRNSKDSTIEEVVLSGYYSSLGVYKIHSFTNEQLKKAKEILKFLEIENIKEKTVATLSTGILRRAIIGRAMVQGPKIFVLDEPTSGLDMRAKANFIKIIRKLAKKFTLVLITHDVEEIFSEITNVALIKDKTIFKKGIKEEILTSENLSNVFGGKIELEIQNNNYHAKIIE